MTLAYRFGCRSHFVACPGTFNTHSGDTQSTAFRPQYGTDTDVMPAKEDNWVLIAAFAESADGAQLNVTYKVNYGAFTVLYVETFRLSTLR